MKKTLTFAAVVMLAVATQAATVGWSSSGLADYNGGKYQIFVIGQKGVTSISQITALLDAGTGVDSYALGTSYIASGKVNAKASDAGQPTLSAGEYTSFAVVFDSASPSSGSSKYVVLSGISTQTKTVDSMAATVSFTTGSVSSIVGNSANWSSFGPVPEPTTVALLAIGLAALGLKRKVA